MVLKSRIFCVRPNIGPYDHTTYQKAVCLWPKPYTWQHWMQISFKICKEFHLIALQFYFGFSRNFFKNFFRFLLTILSQIFLQFLENFYQIFNLYFHISERIPNFWIFFLFSFGKFNRLLIKYNMFQIYNECWHRTLSTTSQNPHVKINKGWVMQPLATPNLYVQYWIISVYVNKSYIVLHIKFVDEQEIIFINWGGGRIFKSISAFLHDKRPKVAKFALFRYYLNF